MKHVTCLVLLAQLLICYNRSSQTKTPNILLLFPDQWRFDWADQYFINNLSIKTPTFNSIVKNGTRFINTLVGAPLCAPSRSCIAAGREYDYTYVPSNSYDFPSNLTSFYKLMQNNGYWVMVSGKDDLCKHSGPGINGTCHQQELGYSDQRRCGGKYVLENYPKVTDPFTTYLSQHFNINNGTNESEYEISYDCFEDCCIDHACSIPLNVHEGSYEDNYITDRTLEMLDNKPTNQPWYLQVNWAGPHDPFIILESMNETVNDRMYPYPMNANESAEDMLISRRDYTAEIENLDKAFAKLIDKIRDLGEYDNTIFCVSSDHGEMLGDYNAWAKSKPWVASSNVPFVCMGPGIKKNNIITKYVTNMDMAGTFLDYTGTEKNESMTTVSLRRFLNGTWTDKENDYRDYVSSGLNNWRMVVKDINDTTTWKFVCCQGSCPARDFSNDKKDGLIKLLFNTKNDLYEENNLAKIYPDVVNEMLPLLPPGFCVPRNSSYYDNE